MAVQEIRDKLPAMVIWMASEAVMEGVKAYHKYRKQHDIEYQKEQSGQAYNYRLAHAYNDNVNIVAEILWKLFYSYSVECQKAIAIVAKSKDGCRSYPESYFDSFVTALEEVQGRPIKIREKEQHPLDDDLLGPGRTK